MVLLWKASQGKTVLIAGDAINGQTEPGGFDGAVEAAFHQVGGIRLRLEGKLTAREMTKRFEPLLDHTFSLILSGHHPDVLITLLSLAILRSSHFSHR